MPELPEVETVCRGLQGAFVGATIDRVEQRRPDLRFPLPQNFVERLTGRRVIALRRRAKYLLAELDDGFALGMHLGMSGSFRIDEPLGQFYHKRHNQSRHDHVVWHMSNGKVVTYNDPRRFGFISLVELAKLDDHPFFVNLGVEPLTPDFNGEVLHRLFAGKKAPLKAALLDQKLIAGLGNIYVCEALHRAGLSPLRAASSLEPDQAACLAQEIKRVLLEAIEAGGSSLRDHRQVNGTLGYFQQNLRVYDRENLPCSRPGCHGTIHRQIQSGRSSFLCSSCQI